MILPHLNDIPESVYLHYPVCRHHCSYCDFNVVSQKSIQNSWSHFEDAWILGIERDLRRLLGDPKKDRSPVKTLYLGGGTPSLISSSGLNRTLEILKGYYDFSTLQEFSLEANPEDVTSEILRIWKELGINRVSLGVQSFQGKILRRLERLATKDKLLEALSLVREEFANHSFDLMLALPDQNLNDLTLDLEWVEKFNPPHISTYLLTIPEDHKWHRSLKLAPRIPNEDQAIQIYEVLCENLKSLGFNHYEVSNFAKPSMFSRHNSNYWDCDSSYLGLGPGAHGYVHAGGRYRYECERDLKKWTSNQDPISYLECLTAEQQSIERLYMSLRTRQWLDAQAFSSRELEGLQDEQVIEMEGSRFRIYERAWIRIDSVASHLLRSS